MACRTRSRTRLCVTDPRAVSFNSSAKTSLPILSQMLAVKSGLPSRSHSSLIRDVGFFIGRPSRLARFGCSESEVAAVISGTSLFIGRFPVLCISDEYCINSRVFAPSVHRRPNSICHSSDSPVTLKLRRQRRMTELSPFGQGRTASELPKHR